MDIRTILRHIYNGRKTIYYALSVSFVLAILIVILTPRKYNSKAILLTESASKSSTSGLLGQLGAMSGMNIGDLMGFNIGGTASGNTLTSEVYPDIVKSTPFLLDILQLKVIDSKHHEPVTVSEYLKNYTKPSPADLLGYLIKKIKSQKTTGKEERYTQNGVIKLSQEESDLLKTLSKMIQIKVRDNDNNLLKKKSKTFSINVEAQDPLVSALLADSVITYLKQYVIDYNTRKAQKDLNFVKTQYLKARKKFYLAQKRLADYSDSNSNVVLASVNIKRERLQREYNLSASVYTSLAQLLEKAKIQVQDHTPVLTVIQPPVVPLKKSAPKTTLIIVEMLLIGGFVGFCIELAKVMIHHPPLD